MIIIAEPGCTSEGSLDHMLATIDAVAETGADAYKATWIEDVSWVLRQRGMGDGEAYRSVYAWHAWPEAWHPILKDRCERRGLRYACTVHTPSAARLVANYVDAIKIASFEATHTDLIRAAVKTGCEVWVSTGMMKAAQVEAIRSPAIRLFHCVSSYPTAIHDLNLSLLRTGLYQGFSDHSPPADIWVGAVAAASGISYIEAHIQHRARPSNPDGVIARSVDQFTTYVQGIRQAVTALGSPIKRVVDAERPMLAYRYANIS